MLIEATVRVTAMSGLPGGCSKVDTSWRAKASKLDDSIIRILPRKSNLFSFCHGCSSDARVRGQKKTRPAKARTPHGILRPSFSQWAHIRVQSVRLLDEENPPPGCESRNGPAEDGAKDEGDGQGDPDESSHQAWLVGGTNLEQPNLCETIQSGATNALEGSEYDAVC